jgi:ATP-dependent DNA helicase RecQ
MDLPDLLQRRFGFPAFRPGQEEIVRHVASGHDALVVMPTGAGKSLCFQVPALARGGTALVISPLIALMKDQVDALVARDVRATCLNSSLPEDEYRARFTALMRGEVEILYVAPERFTPSFLQALQKVDIRLFVIDEAHCLSQWGHDFRPDYLRLGKVREALGKPPTIALTATATPEVQADIAHTLQLDQASRFVRGFDRTNLILDVIDVERTADKDALLAELVGKGPALVYASTRKRVEQATQALRNAGVRAGMYHAGMSPQDRTRIQDAFMADEFPVVVATNAFGMGIDKRDIRAIVHYDMPGTVEAYYQEIGRAGRDGHTSRAVLLFQQGDRRIHQFFIDNAHPPVEWVHQIYNWLLARGSNPVYAGVEELAEVLPADAGERAAATCLYMLVREGLIRRIAPSDRMASIRLLPNAPSAAPTGLRGKVWEHVRVHATLPGYAYTFSPEVWCEDLDLNRDQLTATLRGLEDRGYLEHQAADRTGGVELLQPHLPLQLDERRIRERRSREYAKLDRMFAYATSSCRRRYIIEYFGEAADFERCGTCDACRAGVDPKPVARALTPDESTTVVKVVACLARMERHANQRGFSVDLLVKTLMGSAEAKIKQFGFDLITTYGILGPSHDSARWTARELQDLVRAIIDADLIGEDYTTRRISGKERTYKEVMVTELGWKVMRKECSVEMVFPHAHKLVRRRPVAAPGADVSSALVAALRAVRSEIATEGDVPAYVVASNKTLDDMARLRPLTRKQMLAVHGMGEVRFDRYGDRFLQTIREWAAES